MSEFESSTENAALKQRIIERIEREGGITFHDFMAMTLYEPAIGYYTGEREKLGRAGDYLTSPELTPVFGAMLGRQLREMWQALGPPGEIDIVEAGAGTGVLARDILSWARRTHPDFFAAVRYTIAEISPTLASAQRSRLDSEGLVDKVRWSDTLPAHITGVILSNELLDAMPVHRVAVEGARIREIYVTWDGTRFAEDLRDATRDFAAYFDALGLLPAEGNRAEVNLAASEWMRDAATALDRGFLLTLDYGYEADELYASWRTDGTLLGFYKHNPSADPYARIGKQDLTAHVDFTTVRRAGEAAGLQTLALITQSEFLENVGIAEALAPPTGDTPDMEEYFARRRAVMELIDPGGLGRVKALVQAKGVSDVALSGLAPIR